ncbi:MAG: hypothetical protein ACI956_001276, partial [Nonlabens sp.]
NNGKSAIMQRFILKRPYTISTQAKCRLNHQTSSKTLVRLHPSSNQACVYSSHLSITPKELKKYRTIT